MSDDPHAFVVPVWTKRLGGGKQMLVAYIAGFKTPGEAVEATKVHIGAAEGDEVREPSPVSKATADALNVRPGDVWML